MSELNEVVTSVPRSGPKIRRLLVRDLLSSMRMLRRTPDTQCKTVVSSVFTASNFRQDGHYTPPIRPIQRHVSLDDYPLFGGA
ncbi:MAG: hypothetical protein AAFQ68_19720, partial [Bacteroidota bacterium]